MPQTKPQSSQIVNSASLPKLGLSASSTEDAILASINTELDAPLRLAASFPADAKLNFSNSSISAADGANKVLPPLSGSVLTGITSAYINFQTQALSNAGNFNISWPSSNTVGQYRRVAFTLNSSGTISVTFSSEYATQGALPNAGTLIAASDIPLGYVDLVCTNSAGYFKTAGSATNIVENAYIYRFAAGGSGASAGGGSGVGDDINSLNYQASFTDNLSDTTAIDTSAGKTDSTLYASSYPYIRLAYDATLIAIGSGTGITILIAPSFTVKAGDIMRIGNDARRIVTVINQLTYVVESAFSTDPSMASCCISQAVHTVDLNNYNTGGLSLASQFSDTINSVLVFYKETVAAGDIVFDYGTPNLAFTASSDGTNYCSVATRTTNMTDLSYSTGLPTAGTNLYLRFFSNATSGSGYVNLLNYKAFFHASSTSLSGDSLNVAMCRSDGAGTEVNCAVSVVGGKTRVITTWSYPVGVNSGTPQGAIEVYVDGKYFPRYIDAVVTSSGYYKEISANTVELDTDYTTVGVEIVVKRPAAVIDSTTANATNIAYIQNAAQAAFQGFVDESSQLSATSSAPSASQFYSTIIGRASIPDLANNLKARMGGERMMTQQVQVLQNEFGPNGEPVYSVVNDDRGQIRFGGNITSGNDTDGVWVRSNSQNDFVEVTFYGTGLNVLTVVESTARDIRASVDGGSEGSNLYTAGSTAYNSRNYSHNQVLPVVSGLTEGVHTVRLRNNAASANFYFHGFELVREASTVSVRPGTSYSSQFKKLVSNSATSISSYESIVKEGASVVSLGSKGGRALVYQKSDGTVAAAATATNSAAAYLTSADHTYEEIARTYHWREFGAGRTANDDFSSVAGGSGTTRAFTLDDGTVTLVGNTIAQYTLNSQDGVRLGASGSFLTLTFVGTGLDIIKNGSGATIDPTDVYVDGSLVGSLNNSNANNKTITEKVCSGLPYGTHTVKFIFNGSDTSDYGFLRFIAYRPAKPALPSGAVELADYNVMANYVANATAGADTIGAGVLRKGATREFNFFGTWAATLAATQPLGYNVSASANSGSFKYTFFGTGFDFRFSQGSTGGTFTVAVDGSTNLSSYTTSYYGAGITSFTASTGTLVTNTTSTVGCGVSVSGLSFGVHTVTVTNTVASGTQLFLNSFDIITPIHSYKSNLYADLQSTRSVGSQAISDNRKVEALKQVPAAEKYRGKAISVVSGSVTSTSFVPNPGMSLTVPSRGGWFKTTYVALGSMNTSGGNGYTTFVKIYVNGVATSVQTGSVMDSFSGYFTNEVTDILYLPPGVHNISVYWRVSNGTGYNSVPDNALMVEEL